MKLWNSIKFYVLYLFTPVQKVMQHLGKAETRITKAQVDLLLVKIQPGDILLSHERQRLTSLFIKGFWDHAAIVTPSLYVVESVGGGVRSVPLEEWLYKKDYVKVVRVTQLSESIRTAAARESVGFIGYSYNYTFSSLNLFHWDRKRKGVYCSELVYKSYIMATKVFFKLLPKKAEILPIDFEVFETIHDTTKD